MKEPDRFWDLVICWSSAAAILAIVCFLTGWMDGTIVLRERGAVETERAQK